MEFTIISAIFCIIILLGFYLAHLQARKNNLLAGKQLDIDYAKMINIATAGLSEKNENGAVIETRLGALYTLEQIAQDSIRHHIQIMQILCAYVRTNSPRTDEGDRKAERLGEQDEPDPLREDIQTALTIIGRRSEVHIEKEKEQKYRIDLRNCDLQGGILHEANLPDAFFDNANLTKTQFDNANLTSAWFSEAIINRTEFRKANLTETFFEDDQIMMNIDTFGAYAYKSYSLTNKSLTEYDIDNMFCGEGVFISRDLNRPHHWPRKKLSYDDFMKAYKEWLKTVDEIPF